LKLSALPLVSPKTGKIGSLAVVKNVIATGASENNRLDFLNYADGPEVRANFSSRRPCEDGRIKPDLVAPGTYIASPQSASATDQYASAPISPNHQYQGGTSQAGPTLPAQPPSMFSITAPSSRRATSISPQMRRESPRLRRIFSHPSFRTSTPTRNSVPWQFPG